MQEHIQSNSMHHDAPSHRLNNDEPGSYALLQKNVVSSDERKLHVKSMLVPQLQQHLERVLGKNMAPDVEIADIEDISRWKKKNGEQQQQKYLAQVKIIHTVCVPLILPNEKVSEPAMSPKDSGQYIIEAGISTFELRSEEAKQSEMSPKDSGQDIIEAGISTFEARSEETKQSDMSAKDSRQDIIEAGISTFEVRSEEAKQSEMSPKDSGQDIIEAGISTYEARLEEAKQLEMLLKDSGQDIFEAGISTFKARSEEAKQLEMSPKDSGQDIIEAGISTFEARSEEAKQSESTVKHKEESEIQPAVSTSMVQQEGLLVHLNDFASYDFDNDRCEENFAAGQIWALYDDKDGMPRNYAYINQVCTKPFGALISWLEPKARNEDSIWWLESSTPCWEYVIEKRTHSVSHAACFSHVMKWNMAASGNISIKPEQGDVWALYKSETFYGYEIVQIVGTNEDFSTFTVTPLVKVPGYRSTFMPQNRSFKISMSDFALFSHNIPAYVLKGENALDFDTVCCLELDTAAFLN